jgi:hypothetical protein
MTRSANAPARCTCMSGEDALSTHRAARHDGTCPHSDLTRTTKRYQRQTIRRLPGTRGVTIVLDGGR